MKYVNIYNSLKKAILRREIAPNSRVPSEKALMIKYSVSRITAKRALSELVKAGLIYRIQGKGSFVKEHGRLNSHQILLVLPFSGNQDLGNYVSGIQQVLKDTTWNLLSMTNSEFFSLNIEQIKQNFAGIIYYPQDLTVELPKLLKIFIHSIPITLLDQTISHSIIPSVISDNVQGGYLACKYLIANHHQKILFYTATPFQNNFSTSTGERYLGYIQALKEAHLTNLDPFKFSVYSAVERDKKLIDFIKKRQIDAVIAENDVTAFKLLNLLHDNEIGIPKQISLIGFDNLALTQLTKPKLSSISQDFVQLGTEAINLLLRQINDPDLIFNKQVIVPVQLVKRESTLGEIK